MTITVNHFVFVSQQWSGFIWPIYNDNFQQKMYNYIFNALLISRPISVSLASLIDLYLFMMYVKNKVEFVPHLYSRTAGLLLIYNLLIKNGRRIISSTVLFSTVDRLFKMANNTVLRGG